jgi:lysine-N-methylase
VLLRPEEIERIRSLPWPDSDKALVQDFWHSINGFPYFRRQENGACIFLTEAGVCLMHQRFGFDCKALTCRGYPLNLVSTFTGEISALARMDCPAVLRNEGPLLSESRRDIEALVSEMRFRDGFSRRQLDGLERPVIELLCRVLLEEIADETLPPGYKACHLWQIVRHWQKLGTIFLNDLPTLKMVMPSIREKSRANLADLPKLGLGPFSRAYFRQMLSNYCQRDEEMLITNAASRCRRTLQMLKMFLGGGNLRNFGREHPDFPLSKVKLFRAETRSKPDAGVWESYWRFLSVRLECFQFFGFAYYELPFFAGLAALLLTYPLALAHARISATSQGRTDITAEDVQYAVASLDHCHGRSPRLKFKFSRNAENYFFPVRYPFLVFALGMH